MDYSYVAYNKSKALVKGKVNAINEQAALGMLGYGGYQVVKLTPVASFFDLRKVFERFTKVNPRDLIIFSRQFALIVESGIGAVTSSILSALEGALKRINMGRFTRFIINGSENKVAVVDAGAAILLVMLNRDINMGLVNVDIKDAAAAVKANSKM